MGLFDKVKSILFEEEEVEEVETPKKKEEVIENNNDEDIDIKPLPDVSVEVKPRETHFERVVAEEKPQQEFSERDLFRSESTFKFPAFDEEEFEESMPRPNVVEEKRSSNVLDYERRNKQEQRQQYSRFDSFKAKEEVKEEKKRFKPSPVISPVYGILDKDYKVEDIKEAPKNLDNNILSNKDLDVEIVRKKAFGKLENTLKEAPHKNVVTRETYEIKKETVKEEPVKEIKEEEKVDDVVITTEPIMEDSHNLIEERSKTIDELLKDASDDVIEESAPVDEINYSDLETELKNEFTDKDETKDDIIIDNTFEEEKENKDKVDALENDTLENDLYDLIDSMYDNTEDGE